MLPLMLAMAASCGADATQADLDRCAAAGYRAAQAAHDAQWKRSLAAAGREGGASSLAKAERAWLAYRDGQCEAENAPSSGGSMHAMAVAGCKVRMTRARTRELAAMERAK